MYDITPLDADMATRLMTQDDLRALKASDAWSERYFSRRDSGIQHNAIRNMVHELYSAGYSFCSMLPLDDGDDPIRWCWCREEDDAEFQPLYWLDPVTEVDLSLMVKPMLVIRDAYRAGRRDHQKLVKTTVAMLTGDA